MNITSRIIFPLLFISLLSSDDKDYPYSVEPGSSPEAEYIATSADSRNTVTVKPKSGKFIANSGSVTESKRHSNITWIVASGQNIETQFQARSPSIPAYSSTFVSCAGLFSTGNSGGGGGDVSWKTKLKEKPSHIFITHQYSGDDLTVAAFNSARALRKKYIESDQGAVIIIRYGSGGEISSMSQLSQILESNSFTHSNSVTIDSIGHGAIFDADNRHPGTSVIHAIRTGSDEYVFPSNVIEQLRSPDNNTSMISDDEYWTPLINELKSDKSCTISLSHCYTADAGTLYGSAIKSPAGNTASLSTSSTTVYGYAGYVLLGEDPSTTPGNVSKSFQGSKGQ